MMSKRIILIGILSLLSFLMVGQTSLVIFTQKNGESYADKDFLENYSPELYKLADKKGLKVYVRKVEEGVFKDTKFTPAIYLVTDKKTILYKGRYSSPKRLMAWVNVAKISPSKESDITIEKGFKTTINGLIYGLPLKVIPSFGDGYEKTKKTELSDYIISEFQKNFGEVEFQEKITLHYHDRKYYIDFYPYVNKNKVFLSVKIFSEFHCKIPVFETKTPLIGSLKKLDQLILQAKDLAILKIKDNIEFGSFGDGHTQVPKKTTLINREDLGIKKESKTVGLHLDWHEFPQLSNDWIYNPSLSRYDSSALQFLVPNTIYAGEITSLEAELSLKDMKGSATAHLKTLNTGDEGLDYSIIERILAEKYGTSTIVFKEVLEKSADEINDWSTYQYKILCDFTFAGKTIEKEVDLVLAPVVSLESRKISMYCSASFSLYMMGEFGIESGVGDSEEEDTVEFYVNFIMESKQ